MACRAIKEMHRQAAESLRIDSSSREEIEELLTQLQQLLVGISIMQVDKCIQLSRQSTVFVNFFVLRDAPPGQK